MAVASDPAPAKPILPPARLALETNMRPDIAATIPLPTKASPAAIPQQPVVPPQPEPPAQPGLATQGPPVLAKPAPPPAGIAKAELAGLLAHFAQHYASGNLEGFMALFDESARSEAGGKMQIHNDYTNLFHSSQRREIIIWDMDWRLYGDSANGEGSFQAQVVGNGETAPRTYLGQIRLEVVKHGNTPLITIFKHTVKR
jgi:hypothetical protein